ncbi:Holliday junction resolvase [Candidatus Pacearchaeota archaeon]|nr:Holliday junction resolvase [Candidatus Pacearchaeota archaeon]
MGGTVTARISFIIPGPAKGKGRPQFVRATGIAFTPKATRIQEAFVKSLAAKAMNGKSAFEGPVSLRVEVWVGVAKSWTKKKKEAALTGKAKPTGRPDLDNLIKLLADAMNGVVFKDDSQIVHLEARKDYCDEAKTFVYIEECPPIEDPA